MHGTTEGLQALDARHHLHPFTDTAVLHAQGVRIIQKGEGVYITDSAGRRCLDAMSGLWCVNIGYGRREIAEAAARQMSELAYYNTLFHTTTGPAIELAAQLSEVTPDGFERAFFTSSGSEAVDSAYRIVRHFWNTVGEPERTLIISRENGLSRNDSRGCRYRRHGRDAPSKAGTALALCCTRLSPIGTGRAASPIPRHSGSSAHVRSSN